VVVTRWRATSPRVVITARALLAATAIVVAVIVFTPGPPDESGQRALAAWLDRVHTTWMPGWITFDLIEFASNAVMFLPLGLLGALAMTGRRWVTVPACAALSSAIEVVQSLVLPEREGSWQDIAANSLGALIGCLLALALLRRLALRQPL